MITINFNKRQPVELLKCGETFQIADNYYQKTDLIREPFKKSCAFGCINLKTGELAYFKGTQTAIPKDFILTIKEESESK